jgi:hypothetical protein
MSQFPSTSLVTSQCFGTIKEDLYFSNVFYTEVDKVTVHWATRCCTVLSVGKSHTWNTLGDKRDLSHAVTNSTLSACCAVHSFTDTPTLTQIPVPTLNSHFPHTLYLRHILPQHTHIIPRPITTNLDPQNMWHNYIKLCSEKCILFIILFSTVYIKNTPTCFEPCHSSSSGTHIFITPAIYVR